MQQRSRILWTLAVLAFGVLLLKFFVADIYGVNSGSMRPTIFGGTAEPGGEEFREFVLVAYDRAPALERFDLAVIRSENDNDPVVKRVVGLPGETVRISGGDVLIDGARLPGNVPRPELIPVFDDQLLAVSDFFQLSEEPDGPWRSEGGDWHLAGSGVDGRSNLGLMLFHKDLQDDYLGPDGKRVVGTRQVNDGAIACEVELVRCDDGGRVRLQLVEEGDTFEATLVPNGGQLDVILTRFNAKTLAATDAGNKFEELTRGQVLFASDKPLDLAFANIDNTLTLWIDGERVATASYLANEPHPARTGSGQKSLGPRVALGGAGCDARFRRIRVLRDLYFTPAGEHATRSAISLGPDEYFLLGDNSASSTDSRFFGPVAAGSILGRPLVVLRPLQRLRRLRGAVSAAELVP